MIISRTPLRVSFAGGGTDLASYYTRAEYGAVVSTAINKYIYITVNKKFDDLIRVSYSKTEMVGNVDQLEHNIIREALKIVGIEKGIEVVYMGDIPLGFAGIGLGSSSSLAVGVLNALYAYTGQHVSAERLAQDACRIEIKLLENPIGKQDQYISAYGGFNYIRFNTDESVYIDPIICYSTTKSTLINKLMLFYTGLERISSTILKEQRDNTKSRMKYLNKLAALSGEFRDSLISNNLAKIGEILHQGWLFKKNLASGVTNSTIDNYYNKAREAGAIGGKVLGAGGGGFLLLYVEEKNQQAVRHALKDLKESPFMFEQQGSKIIYVQ